jgi:hypothetical protein
MRFRNPPEVLRWIGLEDDMIHLAREYLMPQQWHRPKVNTSPNELFLRNFLGEILRTSPLRTWVNKALNRLDFIAASSARASLLAR